MKITDANILVYAHDATSPFHSKAKEWLMEALTDPTDPVAIAPVAALAFVRLTTNAKLFSRPLSIDKACDVVESWFAQGAIWCEPGPSHFLEIKNFLAQSHGGPKLLSDAHLAALALHHRAPIYTNDRDFFRFPGLRVVNPL